MPVCYVDVVTLCRSGAEHAFCVLDWSSFRHTLHWLSAYRSYVIAGGLLGLCALVATSEVSGVVLPVVSFIFMYVVLVLFFFHALYLYCPCVGLSVVFIYFLHCCIYLFVV